MPSESKKHKEYWHTNWKLSLTLNAIKRTSRVSERSIDVGSVDWYPDCKADLEERGYKVSAMPVLFYCGKDTTIYTVSW